MPDVPAAASVPDDVEAEPEAIPFPWFQLQQEEPVDDPAPADALPRQIAPEPLGKGDYVVEEGDCIASLAAENGLLPETIWNHKSNAALHDGRRDEYVLLPGDRITIPERTPGSVSAATGKRHRFRRRKVPLHINVVVEGEDGIAYANEKFVVEASGFRAEGTTTAEGLVTSWIPPEVTAAKISFPTLGESLDMGVGALDPVTSVRGVQARLNNLGFFCGPIDGTLNSATLVALRLFRGAHEIAPPKEEGLDEPTLQQLVAEHGS